MAEDERWKGASARHSCSEPAGGGVHYLAKCVFKSSAVLHAVRGHFRSSFFLDIVLGKETSIELVVVSENGIMQSVCDQTVFGIIKDLAVLRWDKSKRSNTEGKDLLVVLSDSGKITFLMFCTEMDRFTPLTHVQLSGPGNSRHQLGRMLAVESTGGYIAVSAYEDYFALLSISTSTSRNIVEKKISYPPESKGPNDLMTFPHGAIWSMSFISRDSHAMRDNYNPILAVIMHRSDISMNELLICGCYNDTNTVNIFSTYSDPGPFAIHITDVPHISGFGLLFRIVDFVLLDLSNPLEPCCLLNVSYSSLRTVAIGKSCRDLDVDDDNIYACTLLALKNSPDYIAKDHAPMYIDDDFNSKLRLVCSWCWEPTESSSPKLMICLDTGDLYILDINYWPGGVKVNVSGSLYNSLPYKALLWVNGGYITAFAEMGDGIVLKLENGKLCAASPIQNIAPILDTLFIDCHEEKQVQMFACCGISSEGSLRIIRNGVNVDRLIRTPSIYQGITGTWAMQMKHSDLHDSFVVLSFVEETRVLSVGLSFVDVSEGVGFQPNVCTLACGLLADCLLVQIHRTEVRLCLPTKSAHPEGIPQTTPICTSWSPHNVSICQGAVGRNLIVIATSNPCFLSILVARSLSAFHHEVSEVQRVELQTEVSCISIPQSSKCEHLAFLADQHHANVWAASVELGRTFVLGTHKPSVEILTFVPNEGIKIVAIGNISINNALGTPVAGCIPEDVRLVLVDRCYLLSGLRNGMLLRFEWPAEFLPSLTGMEAPSHDNHFGKMDISFLSASPPYSLSPKQTDMNKFDILMPIYLQLIAIRHIGTTPVFLVPLRNSLDSDIIVLSDRPWLLQSARHSLAYTSISVEPSTHVTPVNSTDCPEGILFVAENSLNLVEMVQSNRLNVQKFHIGGTPRKILYHKESKTILVLRIGLDGSTHMSDVCRIDPLSGSLLAKFKFGPGETAKCMQIMKVGNEQVLVVGTSETGRLAIMPSGEAESAPGRVVVISLDNNSMEACSNISTSSQISSFHEIAGYAAEQQDILSSHSSSSEDNICEGVKCEEVERGGLKCVTFKKFRGVVMSICPYLDHYFLISAGNILYVYGFLNNNPRQLRRFASVRTRFTITCLSTYLTRIAVGDCRDGVLFFTYQEDQKKLEQLYCDPMQRLIADCLLLNMNTAIVSDKRGSVSILSSISNAEDNASPERNLTQCCAYYMGETIVTMRKGSLLYKSAMNDGSVSSASGEIIPDFSIDTIVAGTLLGSVMAFIPIRSEVYDTLRVVQEKLACHHLTAPVLGNDHNEFRKRGSFAEVPTMLDGDMLSQFLELTSAQQESVLASYCPLDANLASSSSQAKITVNQVVQLLEQIHYALN